MTIGYPKLSYRTVDAGCHKYQVLVQQRPGGARRVIGTVQRYGSLPSMQSWAGRTEGGPVGRSRFSRSDAAADVWSKWEEERCQPSQGRSLSTSGT